MVAASPVHKTTETTPTPIEAAKQKAAEANRTGGKKPELPIKFAIPTDGEFLKDKTEYLDAPDLRYIAGKVIAETSPDLSHINLEDIDFAWKLKGGKDKGKPKLFDVRKQDDVAKFHGGKTWLVWFAADHCRGITGENIATRASVYAALKRIGFTYDDKTEATTPTINPPDLVMFFGELQRYGTWRLELTVADDVFKQPRLSGL